MGVGIEQHIRHYLSWSGRLVADFFSTVILSLYAHHVLTSLIIALISTVECVLIVGIVSVYTGSKFSFKTFALVTALYWVCNPNIGQINFWVVGACNYLLTTTLIASVIFLVARFRNGVSGTVLPFFGILASIAGCTNENSSLGLIYVLVVTFLLFKLQRVRYSRKLAAIVIVGAVIGALVLICAPGNVSRLQNPIFMEWNNLSPIGKVKHHLSRFGDYIHYFQFLLIFYVADLIFLLTKFKDAEVAKRILCSLLFLSASIFTFAVMVGAPIFPRRAYAGPFFFLLVAFACIAVPGLMAGWKRAVHHLLSLCIFVLFCITFISLSASYSIAKDQETLRNGHLNYEKLVGHHDESLTIPSYFLVRLQKSGDSFDFYHSESMKSWFYVREIEVKSVDYDYSIAPLSRPVKVVNKSHYGNVSAYQKGYFFTGKKTLLLVSDMPLPDELHVKYYSDRDAVPKVLTLKNSIRIMDRHYIGLTGTMDEITSLLIEE